MNYIVLLILTNFHYENQQVNAIPLTSDVMKYYLDQRNTLLKTEKKNQIGSTVTLEWFEVNANRKLMRDKLKAGFPFSLYLKWLYCSYHFWI